MKHTLIECLLSAGQILRAHFGHIGQAIRKESQSSIVTEADLASERCISETIRRRYPRHNVIGEESHAVLGTTAALFPAILEMIRQSGAASGRKTAHERMEK